MKHTLLEIAKETRNIFTVVRSKSHYTIVGPLLTENGKDVI